MTACGELLLVIDEHLIETTVPDAGREAGPDPGTERERAAARARVAALMADAEKLVEMARTQADDVIEQAQRRANQRYRQANIEAEDIVTRARAQADKIIATAAASQPQTCEHDCEHHESDGRQQSSQVDQSVGRIADDRGASANDILRIAQAEAEARANQLLEHSNRRIENAETEARRRLEQMRSEYRTMQQRMRQEEFAAKARLLVLREELETFDATKTDLPQPDPVPTRVGPSRGLIGRHTERPNATDDLPPRGIANAPSGAEADSLLRGIRKRA